MNYECSKSLKGTVVACYKVLLILYSRGTEKNREVSQRLYVLLNEIKGYKIEVAKKEIKKNKNKGRL